jgi:filamentous hemagglutinin
MGLGISMTGVSVNASASIGRGRTNSDDLIWNNTHIEAGNLFKVTSGIDTTIKRAVVKGKQVTANVGGNLNVESLQDTSAYDSSQQSIGTSASLGYGGSVYGGVSINADQRKIRSRYASVGEL